MFTRCESENFLWFIESEIKISHMHENVCSILHLLSIAKQGESNHPIYSSPASVVKCDKWLVNAHDIDIELYCWNLFEDINCDKMSIIMLTFSTS